VGVGKTSLLNMVVERLRDDPRFPVVEFNPWLFSGTERLVASFFEEMSAQLRLEKGRLAGFADELEAYGKPCRLCGSCLWSGHGSIVSGVEAPRSGGAWDSLTEVLGGEDGVRVAVDRVEEPEDERLATAVKLARRYLDGWRPRDFPE
jgi:KAP family P-loop domain